MRPWCFWKGQSRGWDGVRGRRFRNYGVLGRIYEGFGDSDGVRLIFPLTRISRPQANCHESESRSSKQLPRSTASRLSGMTMAWRDDQRCNLVFERAPLIDMKLLRSFKVLRKYFCNTRMASELSHIHYQILSRHDLSLYDMSIESSRKHAAEFNKITSSHGSQLPIQA